MQRAVKSARRKLGISVLPHELRHAYATDCLQRGTNPRAIQQAMGHKSLETTMGYLHAEAFNVSSPLDALQIILPAFGKAPVPSADRLPTAAEARNAHQEVLRMSCTRYDQRRIKTLVPLRPRAGLRGDFREWSPGRMLPAG